MTTTRQTILGLTFAVFGLTTCNNSSRQSNPETKATTVDTLTSAVAATYTSDNDTITYDHSTFPIDSTFSTKVLTVGTFHEDEVWKTAESENWFGVFKGNNGCYISQTKIKTLRVFDPVLDEDSLKDKTGWDVQATNRDTCIILIAGPDFLSSRRISQSVLSKDQIFPGDTLSINYLGIDYFR